MTNAEAIATVEKLFKLANVTQVISIDDTYSDEAPASDAVALYRKLEGIDPGVCGAVFGEGSHIDFTSDPDVIREQIEAFWKTIPFEKQRDILTELRSKITAEDDIDKGAKSALPEFFDKYNFIPMSQKRWDAEKEKVFATSKPLTLLLVDEDFSKEPGGGSADGIKIIKEVVNKTNPNIFLCGLLSHGYSANDIHRQWTELCEREGLDKSRFVLIPKQLLDEDPEKLMTFLRLIKLAVLNRPAHDMKMRASEILKEAETSAASRLNAIDIYDFDHIVFRSSEKEGVWEPDTLFRVFGLFHRDETRMRAKRDEALHDLVGNIRVISQVATPTQATPSLSTWKVQRIELYEDPEYLNPYFMPIELGDIFETSGAESHKYILLSQACDLMVRPKGNRHAAITEGLFAEVVKGNQDVRTHAELQYFDPNHSDNYFVSFKNVFAIRLFVLDFCTTNVDGNAEFTSGKACPKLLIPAWQMRWGHLDRFVGETITKYADFLTKGLEPATAAVLVAGCCNEKKLQPSINVEQKKLSYPLRRISRLRQPRAAALLARYANFVAREAFDHDFGTPPEEQSKGGAVKREGVAKSNVPAKHEVIAKKEPVERTTASIKTEEHSTQRGSHESEK